MMDEESGDENVAEYKEVAEDNADEEQEVVDDYMVRKQSGNEVEDEEDKRTGSLKGK
jgi:hypothetical protein